MAPRRARRAARKRPFSLVAGLTKGPFWPPEGPGARRAARKLASKSFLSRGSASKTLFWPLVDPPRKTSLSRGNASKTPGLGPFRAPRKPPSVGAMAQKTLPRSPCAVFDPAGGPQGGPKTAVFSRGRPYEGAILASGRLRGPPEGPKTGLEKLPQQGQRIQVPCFGPLSAQACMTLTCPC